MSKPPHIRISYSGVFGSPGAPLERWSFSVNAVYNETVFDADDAAMDAHAAYCWQGYENHLRTHYGSDVVLTECRVAAIDIDGKTVKRDDGSYVQGIDNRTSVGTQAQQPVPLQQALCVSLTTARSGPTGKGRFFLPWPALSLDNDDKRLPIAQAEDFLEDVRAMLAYLDNSAELQLAVISSKNYESIVTGVRLGRAPDTMRSRREDVPEGYLTVPLHP